MRNNFMRPWRAEVGAGNHLFGTGLGVVAGVFLLLLSITTPGASAQDDLSAQAIQYVSDQQGIPADQLSIGYATTSHFPITGVDLADFKVLATDGRIFGVSFDQATEEVADPAAAAVDEAAERASTMGAIDPALFDTLEPDSTQAIPVAIWASMDDPGDLARMPGGLEILASRVSAAQAAVVQEINAAQGPNTPAAVQLADDVPLVFTELRPGQIIGLAHRPQISAIYGIPDNLTRFVDDTGTSDRYPYIWTKATGSGIQVAVHEDDGVDNVNSFLNNATHGITYWSDTVGAPRNIGGHATNVAGVIASTHNWRRGGAFGISQILSANFQSFSNAQNIVNSEAWAVSNGADTVNMSWGGCTSGAQNFFSRWVDFVVKATGKNVVVSSGNFCAGNFVAAPSLGWNTISAGSYFDNNTGLRTDDVFSSFSSFVNPLDPNSGRTYEKPDVTGMGGQFASGICFGVETTAIGSGFDSTCGTSFSAPDTSALTALAMQKMGATSDAEAVKAIVMAGATHNIVDGVNYTSCPTSPVAGDCRDGAGAIDAKQTISNVVIPGNWRFPGFITPSSFDVNGNIDIPANFSSGKNVRAVIAWDSTATCSSLGTSSQTCPSDVLNADLDLSVLDPFGNFVAGSFSFQNSAEVVDFKAPSTGTYTIRIHSFRFDTGTNTFLGVGWNPNTKDAVTPITGATSFTLNTTKTNQTTDKGHSFWDTYSGPAAGCASFLNPEDGLEKVYKITTSSTGTITASLSSIVGFPGVNGDIDPIILKKSGAANSQNTQVVACGDTVATASGQPAGTYYVVIDGFQGSVAKFSLTVNFAAGAAAGPPPLPPTR